MDLPLKLPEITSVDEKLNVIHQLSHKDPLLPIVKEKFQLEINHHLSSLKGYAKTSSLEVLMKKSTDSEELKQAYLSMGKELAVTKFIFDMSARNLSTRMILLLAEILFAETSYRQKEIFILNINGDRQPTPKPAMIPEEMEKLIDWYNTAVKEKQFHPISLASALHYQLTSIRPFEDWNGRIARLILNVALMKQGYLPILIGSEERSVYYENLEKADKGSIEPLIRFIASKEMKTIDEFMASPEYLSIQAKFELEKQLNKIGNGEKCIVLTEDSATDNLLAILLESSGFRMDETNIISYEGCSKISSANLFSIFVKEKMPHVKILVHRDRDYLTDSEIDMQRNTFQRIDTHFFVTKGTDIESYFLNSKHINFCHPSINETTAQRLIDESMEEVYPKSVDYLRKKEFGGNHPELYTHLNSAIEELVRNNLRRFTHGKTTLKVLQYRVQELAHEKVNLEQPSSHLYVKELNKIARLIWDLPNDTKK
ncbi:MAG TPA: Fic family protein [Prolixibacteraceae bacterium]|nr:Fic family protein [Prolixibacteraceae bacterium]HPS11720.1 Fic family protein [Prolixibacteraceae bacterium]